MIDVGYEKDNEIYKYIYINQPYEHVAGLNFCTGEHKIFRFDEM